jgi:ferredoxin
LLTDIRELLKRYRGAGGKAACILFHDAEVGREWVEAQARSIPERVIPVEIEEIGAVGIDTWLATLAYGASEVALLTVPDTTASVLREVEVQLRVTSAILEGLNDSSDRVRMIRVHGERSATESLQELSERCDEILPAAFEPLDEKRTTIRLALDHLYEQAREPGRHAPLPSGAPFGEIKVNRDTCTLCMACASVCPASALEAGGERPELRFIEWNCVQCGLCDTACPEDAISLAPRVILDPALRRETRILNEEQPFHCVACGKPFATQSIMNRMAEKLKGHWMFQNPEQLRRLQMCEDCRVKDMFKKDRGLLDVDGNPG